MSTNTLQVSSPNNSINLVIDSVSPDPTAFVPFPDYILYLQFAQNCITLVAHLITLSTMGSLVWATHYGLKIVRLKHLSHGLHIFFGANIAFSALGIPYQFYRILAWSRSAKFNTYNMDLLYWLSAPDIVYYGAIPSAVFLLTVERALTLKFPFIWITKNFNLIGTATFLGIVFFNLGGHLVELPLNYEDLAQICQTASCTTSNFRLYYQIGSKIVFSCADVLISFLFLFLLHETGAAKKLNNRVILFTLVIEFVMGVIPTFVMVVFNKFTSVYIGGVPNGGEKGELVIMLCALDGATCGILYCLLLFRRGSLSSTVSILHAPPPMAITFQNNQQRQNQQGNGIEMMVIVHQNNSGNGQKSE